MKLLIVKLSSLGDVVHAMPAVQDLRQLRPAPQIDWVVERGFVPLAEHCEGVRRVIPIDLRRWRRAGWLQARDTLVQMRTFCSELRAEAYDAIIDLQGLTKSALVARLARLAPGGHRYALANRTAGSSYEPPTRWLADVPIPVPARIHAIDRSRLVCSRAFGYVLPATVRFGLTWRAPAYLQSTQAVAPRCVALVHGSSRADKCWPEAHWIDLGQRLLAEGFTLAMPHGSAEEEARSHRLAQALGSNAQIWPRLPLDALTGRLAACVGVVGVDSGLSHIAVALDVPHVQIYNFNTAWRTGPPGNPRHQRSVFGSPAPSVEVVWKAWQTVWRHPSNAERL